MAHPGGTLGRHMEIPPEDLLPLSHHTNLNLPTFSYILPDETTAVNSPVVSASSSPAKVVEKKEHNQLVMKNMDPSSKCHNFFTVQLGKV